VSAASLFDIFSYADITLAVMLLFTPSPLPEIFTHFHIAVLAWKGIAGINPTKINLIPMFLTPIIMPVMMAVDIVSAAVVIVSEPPFLASHKEVIAGMVLIKGVFTSLWTLSIK